MELDNAEKQDFVCDILEDEARLNQKAAADAEKNSDERESQNFFKIKDEIISGKLSGCCQVRVNIYFQITIISINRCKYFQCNLCPQ